MVIRKLALPFLALTTLALGACAKAGEVSHSDYGYCERSVRHKHNDHVFLGDYHDHSLCEWSRYD